FTVIGARFASRQAFSLRTQSPIRAIRSSCDARAGGAAKEGSVATLLFSMGLASRPGGTPAEAVSPSALEGSIAGVTSVAEPVDTSEDSCGSEESGAKTCGEDADPVISGTAVEGSIAAPTFPAGVVETSDEACGPATFDAFKSCGDDPVFVVS